MTPAARPLLRQGPLHAAAGARSRRPDARRCGAYFKGDIGAIDRPAGRRHAGTPFQRSVWQALRQIKGGKTISYAELARRIGKPKAVRAAGLANGQNPISIVVPCHRVIGSNGTPDRLRRRPATQEMAARARRRLGAMIAYG